jgi:hypothetical protein
MKLLDYQKNIYSQNGEDGIIEKIISLLPATDKWCVEFGAWDGTYLSNSFNLIENHGYSAVLIEADRGKFLKLHRKNQTKENIVVLNKLVGLKENNGLDFILADTVITKNFDFLSIDVDGNDFHIWKNISEYRPKIVCIEYNPTIPTEVEFIQPADLSISQGSSLSSLVTLAKEKNYELIAVTSCNAIFVTAELFPLFNITNNSPKILREDNSLISYIFIGYDGTIFTRGNNKVHWHQVSLQERIKQLPRIFRKYPDCYGKIIKFIFEKIYCRKKN